MKDLRQELEQRQQQGLYRRRKILQSPQGREITIDGQQVLNFCSNDYLGLANHPQVKQSFIKAAQEYGVGSGSAHLVNGHTQLHHQLEEELADFCGYPRALLFSTGYMANLAVAQSLCGRKDTIIEDKLNHASLLDAAQLSGGKLKRYLHVDYSSLQSLLQNTVKHSPAGDNREILVSSDAVFSMDGDEADIKTMAQACEQHDAWLMLDDAHGIGVLGDHGKGSLSHQSINPGNVSVYMATLGKAMGTAGAFVAGSEELIEYLIQTARSYIYTTAMPAAVAAATLSSLNILRTSNDSQHALHSNIDYFKHLAQQQNLKLMPSNTAIQPILVGNSELALKLSQQLFNKGLHVAAIRPPTVPKNTARLRITLRADHTESDIQHLVNTLSELL